LFFRLANFKCFVTIRAARYSSADIQSATIERGIG
jgi:hypothetical protein